MGKEEEEVQRAKAGRQTLRSNFYAVSVAREAPSRARTFELVEYAIRLGELQTDLAR